MYHLAMLGVVCQESYVRLHRALLGKKEGKNGITCLNKQDDFPETSSRLSLMPWNAKRIPALRAGKKSKKKVKNKITLWCTHLLGKSSHRLVLT